MTDRSAVIANYRRLYRETYGVETICSDADIVRCWSASRCAPTAQDCDQWTLEDMHAPVVEAQRLGVSL